MYGTDIPFQDNSVDIQVDKLVMYGTDIPFQDNLVDIGR